MLRSLIEDAVELSMLASFLLAIACLAHSGLPT